MNPRWSKTELKIMRIYAKAGWSARDTAYVLRRPYIATRVKASQTKPPIRFNSFAK